MRVMITGANGFIGRSLSLRLLANARLQGQPLTALLLLDQQLSGFPEDKRIRRFLGSVTDAALLRRALADGVDIVFHLASIPGATAESNYELGYQVNLLASLELLNQLRNRVSPPRVIYTSSVALYGAELPARMEEEMKAAPLLAYSSHKLMVETLLAELSRRGEIDGIALRLPGIVARPREPNGLKSAFMSELLHAVAEGERYVCPVSAAATAWWMSARCCVDNLLHAAELDTLHLRVCQLPVLQLSIGQVLRVLADHFGEHSHALIEFAPDPALEQLFGRYPPLRTPQAKAQGFRHDGSARTLIRNALNLSHVRCGPRAATTLAGI